jgi:protein arginine N-methyltransferase 5
LESNTYEVFEKDTIKYSQYEEAVYRALLDRKNRCVYDDAAAGSNGPVSDGSMSEITVAANGGGGGGDGVGVVAVSGAGSSGGGGGKRVVLMVVGAGRGPLVAASMRASRRAGVPLRLFAVEKNPCAVMHIQDMVRREGWQGAVSINGVWCVAVGGGGAPAVQVHALRATCENASDLLAGAYQSA